MDKYYIKIEIAESNNASSKAVNDCNDILEKNGIKPFLLKIRKSGNKYIKKVNNFIQINKINKIKKDSLLVIPHPIYLNRKYIDILMKSKAKRNLKLAFIIHDLDSLRKMFPESADDFEYIDKTMYKIADYIVSHNKKMITYLIENGVEPHKIYDLEIFDYLTDVSPQDKIIKYSKTLNVAGNLDTNKCKYIKGLNEFDKSVNVNLYGLNFDEKILDSQSIHYKGAFPAAEIPSKLTEGFGLVWDGNGTIGCTGNTGEYLKYNNPHKLSLYLVSGMPVVIWREAAEAEFVKNNNVGLLVDSIEQFSEIYDSIDEKEYYEMVNNAKNVSAKLREGYYLSVVIQKILEVC